MCSCACPRCGELLYFNEDTWDMSIICYYCNPYPPRSQPTQAVRTGEDNGSVHRPTPCDNDGSPGYADDDSELPF